MSNATEAQYLSVELVTREALEYYISMQEWSLRSVHATDAERELARYRITAASDALQTL